MAPKARCVLSIARLAIVCCEVQAAAAMSVSLEAPALPPGGTGASPYNGGMETIAIIGGGASGLMAAVEAALTLRCAGAQAHVALFEADDERVGRSILATGNGRCNISNAHIDAQLYRNANFVASAFAALQRAHSTERGSTSGVGAGGGIGAAAANPVLERFADMGLCVREESEGRLYPQANKATSVLDVLRKTAQALGVDVQVAKRAVRVDAPSASGHPFNIRFADKTIAHASAVIVAVGGRAAASIQLPRPLACSSMRPVLGPVRVDARSAKLTRQLNNIRVRCIVRLERAGNPVAAERGELLFRDYGVSGVAVFNLSRHARPGDTLAIDFLPDVPEQQAERFLAARRKRTQQLLDGPVCAERFCDGLVLPAVASVILRTADVKPADQLSKSAIPRLAAALKGLPLTVEGIGDERQCQVRRGGYSVSECSPQTCEALSVPGLFITGEALDVDAPCGGYNLHWAWSTGMLAGRAAAQRIAGAS